MCTIRASKECMYQVASHSLNKRCFYSILNVKMATFQGCITSKYYKNNVYDGNYWKLGTYIL